MIRAVGHRPPVFQFQQEVVLEELFVYVPTEEFLTTTIARPRVARPVKLRRLHKWQGSNIPERDLCVRHEEGKE